MAWGGAKVITASVGALCASTMALAIPAPDYQGEKVDARLCHSLMSLFAQATASIPGEGPEVSKTFQGRADRIEIWIKEEEMRQGVSEQQIDSELAQAIEKFDVAAFDALPEEQAEPIMLWCEQLAGPEG